MAGGKMAGAMMAGARMAGAMVAGALLAGGEGAGAVAGGGVGNAPRGGATGPLCVRSRGQCRPASPVRLAEAFRPRPRLPALLPEDRDDVLHSVLRSAGLARQSRFSYR